MNPALIGNIGPGESRRRQAMGAAMLVAGVAALGTMLALGVTPGWRLLLFIPFWLAALGLFQARERT